MIPQETMKEILLRANTDTIKRYCQTSTIAKRLCDDERFWKEKFARDNLYFPISWDADDNYYIDNYNFFINKLNNIRIALKINAIEKNRTYNKTKGIIIVNIEHMEKDNLRDLSDLLNIEIESDIITFNEIQFHLTDKGYLIKLTRDNKIIDLGYKSIEDVERIFAYTISINEICYDNNGVEFFSMSDPAFEENDINNWYHGKRAIIVTIRRGLWEGMLSK